MNRLHGRIAVSALARRFAESYLHGEYTIIPNGVDVARFAAPLPPIPAMSDGRPTILFVGRFNEPRKGFAVLLKALPYVQAAVPDVHLVVVGKGEPEQFADQLPPDPRAVTFAGMVPAADLPRYYQSATIYCSPATGQESFGIVLLEAMAAGAAIVASDNPGLRQRGHAGAGWAAGAAGGCRQPGRHADPAADPARHPCPAGRRRPPDRAAL